MPETRSNKATLKENISDLSKKFGQKKELSASFKVFCSAAQSAAAVRIHKFSLKLSSESDFVPVEKMRLGNQSSDLDIIRIEACNLSIEYMARTYDSSVLLSYNIQCCKLH